MNEFEVGPNDIRIGPNPFKDMHIAPYEVLQQLDGRGICPKCYRSRKYFCYTCYVPMDEIEDKIPKMKLPIKIDIIKHPQEVDGKSTATHAAIIAPEDVSIYTYPHFPSYQDKDRVLMIFPSQTSVTLEELVVELNLERASTYEEIKQENESQGSNVRSSKVDCEHPNYVDSTVRNCCSKEKCHFETSNCECSCKNNTHTPSTLHQTQPSTSSKNCSTASQQDDFTILKKRFPFDRIIFIDSTWNQVTKIYTDERLQGIRCLVLKQRESSFWRFQRGKPRSYLATIEAVYYTIVDLHTTFISPHHQGQYDNLLFFFRFMYDMIHSTYDCRKLRVYAWGQREPPTSSNPHTQLS